MSAPWGGSALLPRVPPPPPLRRGHGTDKILKRPLALREGTEVPMRFEGDSRRVSHSNPVCTSTGRLLPPFLQAGPPLTLLGHWDAILTRKLWSGIGRSRCWRCCCCCAARRRHRRSARRGSLGRGLGRRLGRADAVAHRELREGQRPLSQSLQVQYTIYCRLTTIYRIWTG